MSQRSIWTRPGARAKVEATYREVLAHWTVPAREHCIRTRAGDAFVLEFGAQDAPPLVLLHGSQANSGAFLFDAARLAERHHVFAVDRTGEPGLSAETRLPLESDAHALWLDEVLDALGVGKVALIGVSLGGWQALDYATRRPARVTALALMCPAGIGRQKNFLLKALPLMLMGPRGMTKVREMVFGPRPDRPPTEAEAAFGRMMTMIGAVFRPRVETIPRLSGDELSALRQPMLVIVGGKDVMLDSGDTARRLAAHKPDAEVVMLPEGRHYLPGQTERIAAFLERVGEN